MEYVMTNEFKRSHCNIYSESRVGNQKRNGCWALLLFCRSLTTAHHKIYVRTDLQWVQDAMEISDERQVKKRPSSRAISTSPNTHKRQDKFPNPQAKSVQRLPPRSHQGLHFFQRSCPLLILLPRLHHLLNAFIKLDSLPSPLSLQAPEASPNVSSGPWSLPNQLPRPHPFPRPFLKLYPLTT